MRVLLSTIGSRGDVQPLVALALELRAFNQDVRLCVPPDFCAWIDGLGLPVVKIGPEVRPYATAGAGAAPPSAERVRQLVEESVATQFETIGSAAADCDMIVAATALQVAARSVAEKRGIPYAFAAYCPAVLPSAHHAPPPLPARGDAPPPGAGPLELWARDAERFNRTFLAALNLHRAAAGLATIADVRSHMFTERPWLAADRALGPWPEPDDPRVCQPGAWIMPDERALPSEVEAFLDAGTPPVYFGFGSTQASPETGGAMVRAARALGRRSIVSRGWADLPLAGQASDCLEIGELNLKKLFTRVAAAVHHGGAGTTTLAALGGAPQVLVPHRYDQHYWARRIAELGVGGALAPGTLAEGTLAAALDRALQPDTVARAVRLALEVRTDGARVTARQIAG
jgi:vancomycin aglycone glucosyltransferase